MRSFRLKTAPATEPVTVADVKLHARVAHAVEDALITTWIAAARKLAEEYQHRAYIQQTWRLVFDSFPPSCFDLPRPPLISVDSVKYYDEDGVEATLSASLYTVDTISEVGRLSLNAGESWPSVTLRPINGVIVEFKAGYGAAAADVPASVKNAIYLYCTWMYENREAETGTVPQAFFDLLKPDRMAVY